MEQPNMRLSIFGLGYVGSVSAACFAKDGREVVGVDSQQIKVDLINQGKAPIIEAGLSELILEMVTAGRLRATLNAAEAISNSDISMVCVGTPSHANGNLDVNSVVRVCEEIGVALREKADFHVVVIRSTILPGTMREVILPTLETASGKTAGVDFGLSNNPEFLREGTALEDFLNPPKTVVGAIEDRSRDIVVGLYAGIDAPMIRTSVEVAEMVKYIDNSWHALKVAFGNEFGNICKALSIDSHELLDIFCQDTKLNLSPYYLKPGFAFGGSCLPKDLRALTYKARSLDLALPVLESILPSNRVQVDRAIQMITEKGRRKIGVLGFSFKAGTDDLRESPLVELIERLIGKGYDLCLYDSNVNLARVVGANREFILQAIPHLSALMVETLDEVLEHSEVIVIGNGDPNFHDVPSRLKPDQILVDMMRVPSHEGLEGRYDGINW
jgi:GDP-mannose 6-dehydrogenase